MLRLTALGVALVPLASFTPPPVIMPLPPTPMTVPVPPEEPEPQPYVASGPTVYVIRCLVTAYTPKDAYTPYTGITSTGTRTADDPHGVAADPKIIPYGSQVMIPGYDPTRYRPANSWWPVDDTGGFLRKSWRNDGVVHLDLRFRKIKNALAWGSRWVDVEVVLPEDATDAQRRALTRRAHETYQLP